jgi:hypothetical protein
MIEVGAGYSRRGRLYKGKGIVSQISHKHGIDKFRLHTSIYKKRLTTKGFNALHGCFDPVMQVYAWTFDKAEQG